MILDIGLLSDSQSTDVCPRRRWYGRMARRRAIKTSRGLRKDAKQISRYHRGSEIPDWFERCEFCRVTAAKFYHHFLHLILSQKDKLITSQHNFLFQKGLGTIITGVAKIVPSSISICYKDDDMKAPVGLIRFNTHREATRALERLKGSSLCDKWRMCMIAYPMKTTKK